MTSPGKSTENEAAPARNTELDAEPFDDLGDATRNFLTGFNDQSEVERRVEARSPASLPINLEIPLPEDPATAGAFEGRVLDMSARGMKVLAEHVSVAFCRKIAADTRSARIEICDARLGGAFHITGTIRWFDYIDAHHADGVGDCLMGVLFDLTDAETLTAYTAFSDRVAEEAHQHP